MAWRGYMYERVIRKAVQAGHDIIACPNTHCYLNFGHKVWAEGAEYRAYGEAQVRDWQQLCGFEPFPAGLTPEQRRCVIGVQGNALGRSSPAPHGTVSLP